MNYADYYEEYLAQQADVTTKKPTKKTVNGKVVYYDNQGKKTTKATYDKQLKAYTKENTYTTKTKNGKTKYYKGGKEITKSEYQKGTSSKISYSTKTVNGKTKYYRTVDGKKTEISKTAYNNGKAGKPYKESGKYYDKNGKEISQKTYKTQTQKVQQQATETANKKIVEKTKISPNTKSDFTDQYRPQLESLAKQYLDTKAPTYKKEKAIVDNAEYINQRDALAKSLVNGTYYDPETDARAKQLREDYTRQGRQAMRDTIADASKRTGGLASSYATAAAAQAYNEYMDNLASKVNIDLRKLAEQSARNNASMYDAMNTNYRTGQQQNNSVIAANNNILRQQYADALNQYAKGLGMYNGLSNTDYSRWLSGRQQGEAERQFDEDLAYRYAALEANQTPMSGLTGTRVGGISSGGGGTTGGGGGTTGGGESTNNFVNGDGTIYINGYGNVNKSQADSLVNSGQVNKSYDYYGSSYYTPNIGIDYGKDPRYSSTSYSDVDEKNKSNGYVVW